MTGEVGKAGEQSVWGLDHPLVVELFLGGGADSVVVGDKIGEDLDQLVKDILGHVRHDGDYMCIFLRVMCEREGVSMRECECEEEDYAG